ncbi:MAG TPA: hypothetical protein VM533_00120 [Fimbriiglobus sp.]|jgi:hypothetical protein|nr:hypothetical protein [Fimbriiglobus sp.]
MHTLRRSLAAVFGLAGAAGLVACITGIVGCCTLYTELTTRSDRVFGRAKGALSGLRDDLSQVRDRLLQTEQDLNAVQQREEELVTRPSADRDKRRALSRKAVEGASPQIGDARRKLVTATEAALVANGLLDALAELPLGERVGVDADRLRGASDQLSELIGQADRLAVLLAGSAPGVTPGGAADQSARIAEALGRVVAALDEGATRTDDARERVGVWHAQVTRWLALTAVAVTVVLVWAGVGQLCLLVHACRWGRGR